MIKAELSIEAERCAQRRGIAHKTLDLIFANADRSRRISRNARIVWISSEARERMIWQGFPAKDVERTGGIRLIVDQADDLVVTVGRSGPRRGGLRSLRPNFAPTLLPNGRTPL